MRKVITILAVVLTTLVVASCQAAPRPAPLPPTLDATQVALAVNATNTAMAAQNPTPTSVPPTPTLEPSPTLPPPTSTPALEAGDPALELGQPVGVDTFDAAVNFAPEEQEDQLKAAFAED
jgi:hypothetical protein